MEHVLALAAIIREVNGGQRLGAAALVNFYSHQHLHH
jgi:hypothetical protein